MSSVTDLKNLSAGDLTSRSPEETSILYLFIFSFVSISFVGLVYVLASIRVRFGCYGSVYIYRVHHEQCINYFHLTPPIYLFFTICNFFKV